MFNTPKEVKIFYSYAREDQKYLHKIEKHLAPIKRTYNLFSWSDRQIEAGTEWGSRLEEALNSADIILLLISPGFFASNHCYTEMQRAIERQSKGLAIILPILLRPVALEGTPLSTSLLLPDNAQPISMWAKEDDAFLNVVRAIEKAVQNVLPSQRFDKLEEPLHIFYCYAKEDRELRDCLEIHLKPLKRQFRFVSWHEQEIEPGKEWEKEMEAYLTTAQIVLLLVSPHFMASDYCYTQQMYRALERHQSGYARVIPIFLRDVDLEDAPFYRLQALPTDAIPVTLWSDRDAAFANIARGIRKILKEMILR